MFPLGEDVFISTSMFKDRLLVNMRRYNKYNGEKYYPTKEGVTLTPYQFIHLVNSSFLRAKSTIKEKNDSLYEYFINLPTLIDPVTVYSDTSVGIQDKDKSQNIVVIEFSETVLLKKTTTCRSGNTYTTSLTLSDEQWDKIFSLREFLLDNLHSLKYSSLDFKKMFEEMHSVPLSAPEDDGTITEILKYLLRTEIYILLAHHKDLSNPMEVSRDELSNNSHLHFYEATMNLKPCNIVKNFYNTVKNKTHHPVSGKNLLNFVTAHFLQSIDLVEILQIARNDFCTHLE